MTTQRFDAQASSWDEAPHRVALARDVADAIWERIPLSKSLTVLDFGCGTGLLSLALRPSVGDILGVDASVGMLEVLAKKIKYGGVSSYTIRQIPEDRPLDLPERFGLIVSSMTLHHVEDVPALIARLAAHLQPGGWLALADLAEEDGSFHADPTGVFHHGFAPAALKKAFAGAGLAEIEVAKASVVVREKKKYPVLLATGRKQ